MTEVLETEFLQSLFVCLAIGLSTGIVVSVLILVCTEILHTFKISTK